jgi:hypothetical protein
VLHLPLHAHILFLAQAVEGFFAKLSKRRLKRGVFRSVVDDVGIKVVAQLVTGGENLGNLVSRITVRNYSVVDVTECA